MEFFVTDPLCPTLTKDDEGQPIPEERVTEPDHVSSHPCSLIKGKRSSGRTTQGRFRPAARRHNEYCGIGDCNYEPIEQHILGISDFGEARNAPQQTISTDIA
ncbi:uncharacterized protein N7484_006809 [Penicillium longicatenatum]|uniref:uncharacterized protein n=1 Tax=Penicillium longicatenatum TaxID=1561947 RepID=UPI002546B105|nr:uncharacterized protein N7484_006809 [Penicillium longicatenatum]KAJ5638947.1 hypothetical protein N7484_006809 [Penicillium longicatenatum]